MSSSGPWGVTWPHYLGQGSTIARVIDAARITIALPQNSNQTKPNPDCTTVFYLG